MPELPDVEGYKQYIEEHALGKALVEVDPVVVPGQKTRSLQMPEIEFAALVEGRSWKGAERRGKFLIVELDDGNSLVFHFMLTGALAYLAKGENDDRIANARVRFVFEDGSRLLFTDRRNLGRIFWAEDKNYQKAGVLAELGVEPLSRGFTRARWHQLIAGDHRGDMKIKDLLCDQTAVAGIGNVYSDKILWRARVRPDRITRSLTANEEAGLHEAIKDVLREAVKAVRNGTAAADPWLQARHKGAACPRCGSRIEALPRGAAHSYFCPSCQR